MKKIALTLFLLLLTVVSSQAAFIDSVPVGDWNAQFNNFTQVYKPDGSLATLGDRPTIGYYLKSEYNLNSVIPKGGGLPKWIPTATDQVAGFEYNTFFIAETALGSGSFKQWWGYNPTLGQSPSELDLFERNPFVWNTGATFAPQTGPVPLGTGGAGSPGTMTGINDAGATTLALLQLLAHPDQSFAVDFPTLAADGWIATSVITTNEVTATGGGDIYADIIGGLLDSSIVHQLMGPAQIPADFYLKFSYNINPPLYGFMVRSEDPADFSIAAVPEPSTILLLGGGLLGLAFLKRRKS